MNLNPFKLIKKLVYKLALSELSHLFIKSWTESGNEWVRDDYRLTHKPTKIQLWIGNGRWFFNVINENSHTDSTGNIPIGYFERHILWHEYKSITKGIEKSKAKKAHAELINKLTQKPYQPAESEQPIAKASKTPRKVAIKS